MDAWKEELYHHGILGMKWGAQNGPPYPLGSGDHSASEKRAGWRKSLSALDRKRNIKRIKKNKANRDRVIVKKRSKAERKIETKYKKNKITSKEYISQIKAVNKKARKDLKRSKSIYKKQRKDVNKEHVSSIAKVGLSTAAIVLTAYGGYAVATGKYSNNDVFFKSGKAMLDAEYRLASKAVKKSAKYGMNWIRNNPAAMVVPAATISIDIANRINSFKRNKK